MLFSGAPAMGLGILDGSPFEERIAALLLRSGILGTVRDAVAPARWAELANRACPAGSRDSSLVPQRHCWASHHPASGDDVDVRQRGQQLGGWQRRNPEAPAWLVNQCRMDRTRYNKRSADAINPTCRPQ